MNGATTNNFPTTSDISMLMRELGFDWSNQTQVYYDYNCQLISRKAAERIYKKLLGSNPYSPVGIKGVVVHPNDITIKDK